MRHVNGKGGLGRRAVLKGGVGAGVILAAPAIISSKARASSGEINILMWSDYLPETFTGAFEKATGIKINFTGIGSNEEIVNKLKATKGRGFDIVSPTNNRSLQWQPLELLQPFDTARMDMSAVNPAMAKIGTTDWAFEEGKASPGAPTNSPPRACCRLTATSGPMKTPARPWAAAIR